MPRPRSEAENQQASFIRKLRTLITEGEAFTYENFSSKSARGYPQAPTPKWLAWTERVRTVPKVLVKGSEPARIIHNGLNIAILGNDQSQFEQAKALMLSGLHAAMIVAKDRPLLASLSSPVIPLSSRVFIVHGHDHAAKGELEHYVRELGLEPIVLHRQPDEGRTLIEKIEKNSDVGYAFVLLTPDDIGYPKDEDRVSDDQRKKENRARQNVVLEFGFFVGRLTRANVCCLYSGGITLPSDMHGLLYKPFNSSVREVFYDIRTELLARGYNLK